mmetsp:Transcript_1743/g.3732  ORF Transcript_1743/g.3732 Transcript_1743/m.3732 type:complete len:200 (-) Transcript_1743:818-1417(-)
MMTMMAMPTAVGSWKAPSPPQGLPPTRSAPTLQVPARVATGSWPWLRLATLPRGGRSRGCQLFAGQRTFPSQGALMQEEVVVASRRCRRWGRPSLKRTTLQPQTTQPLPKPLRREGHRITPQKTTKEGHRISPQKTKPKTKPYSAPAPTPSPRPAHHLPLSFPSRPSPRLDPHHALLGPAPPPQNLPPFAPAWLHPFVP